MKVCLIQPRYYSDFSKADECFEWEMAALDACTEDLDIIVMPESSDIPCLSHGKADSAYAYEHFNARLKAKAAETAKRCNAVLFTNCRDKVGDNVRNTTFAFNRNGEIVGKYYKQHLTPGETRKLDSAYTYEYEEPTVVEIDGLRYCFMTCYDFYFYEAFSAISRMKPDIIIGCSHQRSDTKTALEIFSQNLAYNTNAYVLRASVSMGEDAELGGCSMVVTPDGRVLCNMGSRIGVECIDIDPTAKYYKPAGFNNPPTAHYEYVDRGRRPMKYRPAGPFVVPDDEHMPYPRVCAHRGFCTIAPENTMPSFGAAVALGANEIEFDLWETADGEVVTVHSSKLEVVSNGTGRVWEKTLAELKALDFGSRFSPNYKDLRMPTFEEILKQFACRCIMNIHIKSRSNTEPLSEEFLKKVISLIYKYDCEKHVYFMCGNDCVLEQLMNLAPEIARCVGAGSAPYEQVERAIKYKAKKIQLFKDKWHEDAVARAHEAGLRVTICSSENEDSCLRYLGLGIDTILTDNCLLILNVLKNQ